MSTKGAKGKGKSRGGMSSQNHRSHSRNTTPASTSAFSADTMVSEYQSSARVTYEDLFDRLNLSNNPGIPTSTALQALDVDLKTLRENARTRHLAADKALRTVLSRLEQQKNRADALEQEKKDEQERRDRIIVTKFKKRKAESDHKRPLAVGAHQPTNQDGKEKKKKSPGVKAAPASPEDTSDLEHQPPHAAPYVVFEPLDDDPAVYEIPAVTSDTPYAEKATAFAVTRFPEDDLSSLIPGDPPDEDFSKAKPTNQVNMNAFGSYIEPYFRPFSEEDVAFLRERGDRITPYVIPKLGKHYSEQWADEDPVSTIASPAPPSSSPSANKPRGAPTDLEDPFEQDTISVGPLLSRVLAAFIPEEPETSAPPPATPDTPAAPDSATHIAAATSPTARPPNQRLDYGNMEDRMRRDLVYVGLVSPSQSLDFDNREDDEVSARLRLLQNQLKEQSALNGARKARIAHHAKELLAYQEYATILDDLDKQVEQAFQKRSRGMKQGKKKKGVGVGVARGYVGIGEQARMLMERRKRWVETIGPVFDKDLTILPTNTIFGNLDEEIEKEHKGREDAD